MKRKTPVGPIAAACRKEALAARQQAQASAARASALRQVAKARRAVARLDGERGERLLREAELSGREALLHERAARVFRAEARRAKKQADAEEAIVARRAIERD